MKRGVFFRVQTIGAHNGSGKAPDAPFDRCKTSGKRRYLTKAFADAAALIWSRHNATDARSYHCANCDGWHLTHRRNPEQ